LGAQEGFHANILKKKKKTLFPKHVVSWTGVGTQGLTNARQGKVYHSVILQFCPPLLCFETESYYLAQAGLELLVLLPQLLCAEITGVYHHAWLFFFFFCLQVDL
jgi:hypothetical protein